ncbi:MAG: DUF2012 domain-containing protein [Halieaceae bacterium]|jgi:hypothetical protein|nr:DUF2012 domain-containing protein [Halieaceae bacterium]
MKPGLPTALLISVLTIMTSSTAFAAYKAGDVADGGTIKGKLTFDGELPGDAVEKIAITKNPDVCGEGYREVIWVDVADGALRGAFVFLDKIKEGKAWPAPEGDGYMVNQEGCRFTPWAQIVERGDITIRNSDKGVLHNINTREMIGVEKGRVVKRTMFNFGQPDPGDIEKKIKPRRSPYISLNCEAHNFMFGFMLAPEHPYAAVVDESGSFSIDNVPPGTYKLKAWHPSLGVQTAEVTVEAKGTIESNFVFTKTGSE